MQTKAHSLLSLHPYHLSQDGRAKLLDIRDQLFFLAALAYPNIEQDERVMVEVCRSELGENFEKFALQINEVLKEAIALPGMDDDVGRHDD